MSRQSHIKLAERVARAADASLAAQHFVSPVEVFLGMGWLNPGIMRSWRQGQLDCLEQAIQARPSRVAEAMELLRTWAADKGLSPSLTDYVARTPQRQPLRFSRTGNPAVEEQYRTHWISGELPAKQRERQAEKASRPPELVVVLPLKSEWTCHRCGGTGDLLIMENSGPACLRCAGLDDLEYLPAGDALLTRRAKARSKRSAIIVKFSRSRNRYERQGILVEPESLAQARREIEVQRSR